MKTLLAIPSHHQEQYAERMAAALDALVVKPDKVLILLDRPTGQEIVATRRAYSKLPFVEIKLCMSLPLYVGRPHMLYGEEYFCAGHMRNLAIDYMHRNGYDTVIFADGDCYPEPNLISGHQDILGRSEPVVTVGRRLEAKWNWADQRQKSPDFPIDIFKSVPYKVTEEVYYVDSGVVWTCNFGMNMAAIEFLANLNEKLYGRHETFSSDFLGTWGGEDGFIGFECYYGGIDLITLPIGTNGIRHNEHERPQKKYDHVTFLEVLEQRREELMYLLKLHGYDCGGHEYIHKDIIIGDRSWQRQAKKSKK